MLNSFSVAPAAAAGDAHVAITPLTAISGITNGGTTDITHADLTGITPKAALVISRVTNNTGGEINISYGACDGSASQCCFHTVADDGDTSSDVLRGFDNTRTILHLSTTATTLVNFSAAMISGGVRLTSQNNQANNIEVAVIFFYGDDCEASVAATNLGTGTSAITVTPGFATDAVFTFGANIGTGQSSALAMRIGMAIANGSQMSFVAFGQDNQAAADIATNLHSTRGLSGVDATPAVTTTIQFGNFTATGFDMTPSASQGSAYAGTLAVSFGSKSVALFTTSTATLTGNQTFSSAGFTPEFAFGLFSYATALDSPQGNNDAASVMTLGACTDSDQFAYTFRYDAGSDPTDGHSDIISTQTFEMPTPAAGAGMTGAFSSFGASGPVINWSAVTGSAHIGFMFCLAA
jgi:hypothetical protein